MAAAQNQPTVQIAFECSHIHPRQVGVLLDGLIGRKVILTQTNHVPTGDGIGRGIHIHTPHPHAAGVCVQHVQEGKGRNKVDLLHGDQCPAATVKEVLRSGIAEVTGVFRIKRNGDRCKRNS